MSDATGTSKGAGQPVPYQYLFAFSASVQHVSKKADSSGERIVQVDVEHLAINFISKEVIRKSVAINEVADMQLNTRQLRRLIITDTSQEQAILTFENRDELTLFQAVVRDLQLGKHPGNRISVPIVRQGSIMKRNRTGFYNIRHATLMAGRLVLTRSKGSTPPTDVLTLQDASVFMDEKKGTVSVTSSGRTSSWKGMDLQDTFRWHDALTSALTRTGMNREVPSLGKKVPRLSTLNEAQVAAAARRESMFQQGVMLDEEDMEPPELDASVQSPLPTELIKNASVPPEQEEPQARQSEEQLTLGMSVPKIIKTMTEKYTKEKSRLKQRQAAMSTFTNFDAAQLERKSNGSEGSASVDASLGTPSASDESFSSQQRVGKRMSAEQASSITQLQMVQRTASAPPAMPKGKPGSQSLMLAMADDGTVNDADDADEPYVEDLQTKLSNASDLAQPPTPRQAAAPRAAPSSPLAQPAPSAASAKSTREHVRFLELMSNSGAPHTAAGSPGFPALGQLRNVSPDRTGAPAASKWAPAIRHHVQAIHDRHQRLWQMVQELKEKLLHTQQDSELMHSLRDLETLLEETPFAEQSPDDEWEDEEELQAYDDQLAYSQASDEAAPAAPNPQGALGQGRGVSPRRQQNITATLQHLKVATQAVQAFKNSMFSSPEPGSPLDGPQGAASPMRASDPVASPQRGERGWPPVQSNSPAALPVRSAASLAPQQGSGAQRPASARWYPAANATSAHVHNWQQAAHALHPSASEYPDAPSQSADGSATYAHQDAPAVMLRPLVGGPNALHAQQYERRAVQPAGQASAHPAAGPAAQDDARDWTGGKRLSAASVTSDLEPAASMDVHTGNRRWDRNTWYSSQDAPPAQPEGLHGSLPTAIALGAHNTLQRVYHDAPNAGNAPQRTQPRPQSAATHPAHAPMYSSSTQQQQQQQQQQQHRSPVPQASQQADATWRSAPSYGAYVPPQEGLHFQQRWHTQEGAAERFNDQHSARDGDANQPPAGHYPVTAQQTEAASTEQSQQEPQYENPLYEVTSGPPSPRANIQLQPHRPLPGSVAPWAPTTKMPPAGSMLPQQGRAPSTGSADPREWEESWEQSHARGVMASGETYLTTPPSPATSGASAALWPQEDAHEQRNVTDLVHDMRMTEYRLQHAIQSLSLTGQGFLGTSSGEFRASSAPSSQLAGPSKEQVGNEPPAQQVTPASPVQSSAPPGAEISRASSTIPSAVSARQVAAVPVRDAKRAQSAQRTRPASGSSRSTSRSSSPTLSQRVSQRMRLRVARKARATAVASRPRAQSPAARTLPARGAVTDWETAGKRQALDVGAQFVVQDISWSDSQVHRRQASTIDTSDTAWSEEGRSSPDWPSNQSSNARMQASRQPQSAVVYSGNSGYSNDGADWTMPTDSQRPSYYEPTVAILREAGIDVQKDWFLPAQRGSATLVHRSALQMISEVANAAVLSASAAAEQLTRALPPSSGASPVVSMHGHLGVHIAASAAAQLERHHSDERYLRSSANGSEFAPLIAENATHGLRRYSTDSIAAVHPAWSDWRERTSNYEPPVAAVGAKDLVAPAAQSSTFASMQQQPKQVVAAADAGADNWSIKAVHESGGAKLPLPGAGHMPRAMVMVAEVSQKETLPSGTVSPMTAEVQGLFGALERKEVNAAEFYAALERISNTPPQSPMKI